MSNPNTLAGKLGNEEIWAQCISCDRMSKVDIQSLIDRLGPDFVVVGNPPPLLKHLKCSICGKQADAISMPSATSGYGVG